MHFMFQWIISIIYNFNCNQLILIYWHFLKKKLTLAVGSIVAKRIVCKFSTVYGIHTNCANAQMIFFFYSRITWRERTFRVCRAQVPLKFCSSLLSVVVGKKLMSSHTKIDQVVANILEILPRSKYLCAPHSCALQSRHPYMIPHWM